MKNLFNKANGKAIPATLRVFLFLALALMAATTVSAQCTGCTSTTSTNSTITVNSGQVVCLTYSGTYTRTINLNGGTLCISAATTINGATINYNSASTILNNGTISQALTIGNGYVLNNNTGANITGNLTVSLGGTVSNAGTISANVSGSAGSTITNSGTMTITGGTISGTFNTTSGSTTTNSNGTINGTTSIGGTMNNNNNMSGTITVASGGTLNTGSNLSGTLIVNGAFVVNGGASPSIASVTVNNGGIITNNGTIQGGTITAASGSTINNNGTISDVVNESGTFNNNNGGNVSGTMNSLAGSTTTNYSGGRFTGTTNIAGTFTNNSGGTLNTVIESAGGNFTNAGSATAGIVVNGGSFTEASTGSISGGGAYNLTVNGGTATMNGNIANVKVAGGTLNNNVTIGTQINVSGGVVNNNGTISGSYTQNGGTVNNYATITPSSLSLTAGTDSITNFSGATLTFPGGTNTLPGGLVVTNLGTFTNSGPLNVNSGATLNLEGTQNLSSSQVTNSGTINLAGNLTVSTYAGAGSTNEISPGCNTLTAGSNSSTGTFNGGSSTYGGGLIVNSYAAGATYSNGASATITAPTQQPTTFGASVSALTVTGNITSPSATITGYIVLAYIGSSATTDAPANNTAYTVGSTVGSSTVVAMISGGSTGVKTFTQSLTAAACGQTVYYRIFSYNGAGGCTSYDLTSPLTGSIAINTMNATITPSGATTFCSGSNVVLTAGGTGAASYSWSTGASTAAITATTSNTYTVTVSNAAGCTGTASSVVTVNTVPTAVTVSGGGTFCGSAVLTATGGTNGTIYWENTTSNGTATTTPSASQTVTSSGTYYFRANNSCGWSAQGSATVTINAIPANSPIVGATTVCAGATTLLTDATALGTWSSSNTNVATVVAGLVTGVAAGTDTISYTTTNILTGCANVSTFTITVNAVPAAVTVSGGTIQCGGTETLTATGGAGGTIYWENTTSNGTSTATSSASQTVSTSGTYYFRANNTCGWGTQGSTTVNILTVPAAPTASPVAICLGQTGQLNATSAGNNIKWWTAATGGTLLTTVASGANYAVTPATTTTYYAEAITGSGCVSATRTAVTVTVNALPTPSITPAATALCSGGSVVLTAAGGVSYAWSNGITTTNDTVAPTATTTYTVTATNVNGCTATASKVVTIYALPTVSVNNATSCSGAPDTLVATVTGATRYAWSRSAADTLSSLITSTAGTYRVTVTSANGCTATASGTVTAVANPTPSVTNPAVCAGNTATITASGAGVGGTYVWSTGATTASINTTTAGLYNVTVTNSSGCSATASGIVTVNPLPVATVNSDTICAGNVATLTANGGVLYQWNTTPVQTTQSINVTTAGTYTVTVTSMGSCTATAAGIVTISAVPSVSVTNGVICSGAPTTITATGGTGYAWSNSLTTASITVSAAGTYTVTASNTSGCTASATSTVTTSANPTPTVNSPSICAGSSATLTAAGAGTGGSYLWSTGATTASITVSPAATTTYTVTATNSSGCSGTVVSTVTVNALPVAATTSGTICTGATTDPAVLTASGGTSYHWSNGATTQSISTTSVIPASYTVTVTNAAGCTATATGTVSTAVKPTPTVSSAAGCSGTTSTITATGGGNYVWSTGATTASITVSPATTTTYTVTVTNAATCTASASGAVTVYPAPSVSVSSNSPVLLNGTINITSAVSGGTSAYTYSWSGPSSYTSTTANPSIASAQPTNGGVYNVTVTDAHSCTTTGNATVILNFTSPGGIPSNDALWLNANVGVTASGGNVSAWADQSGLTNNATVVNGTAPTITTNAINSYPVINFAANGGLKGTFGTAIKSSSISSFVVTKASASSVTGSGIFSIDSTSATDSVTANSASVFESGYNAVLSARGSAVRGKYSNANALGQYHMFTSIFSSTSNQDLFYNEGVAATSAAYTSAPFGSYLYTIGSRFIGSAASKYYNGQIAEVILFNTQVTAAQKNQVESYLATKYGFTLDQTTATNYVASNGTIFWNAATNGVYKNNIFGVGIDNVSTLNQTQSVSINNSNLSINSATGLSYYSFLMVADNAGANTLTAQTNLPNGINAKISTVWRVSQTGSRATANYVFNSSATSFGYYAPISSSMAMFMLVDSNADGVYESYIASTTTGTTGTFNANLKDGALFTFGFKASLDFGDAPTVPTLMANNGAGHMIVSGVYLGSKIDAELDGQPSVNSLGDDTLGLADEDGVNFNIGVPTTNNIVTMGSNTITVTASVAGYLNAWGDFNQDGTYGGGSEYAIQNVHLNAGINTITFYVSDSVEYGPTSMRFRFATGSGDVTAPTGLATNGEVEDYKVYVTAPLVGACTNGFQNAGFELGPDIGTNNYIITSETNLPYWRTTATDHMIEQWGNNFNGVPAHGGSYFMELEANLYGALYQDVYTTPGTKLIWSFAHRGRAGSDTAQLKIGAPGATTLQTTAIDGTSGWGMHSGYYTVPAGQYITRLEFWAVGSYGGNNSIGNFLDDVSVASSFDYGDAPNSYGTLFASNGPYHSITGSLYLGSGETCDGDGQPSATAGLDSLDDGVTFPAACANCNTYTVSINAYNNTGSNATIAGWIDFNKNGVFDASERTSVTIPSSASTQTVSMTFTVSTFSASSTGTYARFRIANDNTEIATPYGLATSGEVEDYKVPCVALPTAIPTASAPACARGPLSLFATGTAPFYNWTGPNGFTSNLQNPTIPNIPAADSGWYRVYAVYANGCTTDSAVKVSISNCTANIAGKIFDDANGNGIMDGTDAATTQGQTIYAVLADNSNTVIATTLIASNGTFTFSNAPAYMSGMSIVASTTNPAVGSTSAGPQWPSRWTGTKANYGTSNQAGTGLYSIPNLVPVSTSVGAITGVLLGYDRLPTSTVRTYTIPYPGINSQKALSPANGFGSLAGSDPEDGTFGATSTFTITSVAGMQGNKLYYDANGDGTLQSYEQITGYTTITNFDPTKLIVSFVGAGSTQAVFNYGTTDIANKVDPTPAAYTIRWVGTLPVTMLYFEAQKQGESASLLKWATATEIDNDHFEIERSADANEWIKIGQQAGAGTTSEQQNYTFLDEQPLNGTNYYRLKQVDVDGHFTYTNIATVTFGEVQAEAKSESRLSVYPNPLNQANKLNIEMVGDDNITEVFITNSVGQVVYTTNLPQIQSYQIFGLNLPSGVYIVSAHTQSNNVISSRLVITK